MTGGSNLLDHSRVWPRREHNWWVPRWVGKLAPAVTVLMVWSCLLQFHFSSKLDRSVTNLFGVGAWLEFFRDRKVSFNVRRVAKREGLQSTQPHESSLVSPNFCLCSSISLTPRPGPPKLGSSRKLLSQRNVRFESLNPCSNGNPWICYPRDRVYAYLSL